jgi:hypothetical protein
MFKLLGYSKITQTAVFTGQFTDLFPSMRTNSSFMKQWSVRRRVIDDGDDVWDFRKFEAMLDCRWEEDLAPNQ